MSSYDPIPPQPPQQQPWTPQHPTQPMPLQGAYGQPPLGPQPPRQTGSKKLPIIAGVVAGAVGLLGIIGATVGGSDTTATVDPRPSLSSAAPSASSTSSAPRPASTATSAPSAARTTSSPPKPAPKPAAKTEQPAAKPESKPAPYETVSKRQWSKIMKNPDKFVGKRYIVYGEITQFDSATGDDSFRADTAHEDTTSYGYFDGDNTILTGNADMLEDFVQGDVFRASVVVQGSYSYDTQIGGNTTVPMLQVNHIKRIGNNS